MKQRLWSYTIRSALAFCMAGLMPAASQAGKSISVPSEKAPTIAAAMSKASAGDTVWVEAGVYRERVMVNPGVALKSRSLHKATINGSKRGVVVSLAKNSVISGFKISNGTIGVFAKARGAAITQCRIYNNHQSGIVCVRNLARIEDNVIVFNGASGIQLYDVTATTGIINHNTISFNGNHGIRVGGVSTATIQNNILAFNDRFGISTAASAKEVKIVSNNVYRNVVGSPPIPPGNASYDPEFAAPRVKMDFKTTSADATNKKGSDNETIGARLIF